MAAGESCAFLLQKFTNIKTLDNLYLWNKNTFGWMGCSNVYPYAGDKVCVSEGTPPKPNINPNAECGPQASSDSPSCPLNACCSQYGYCGTTSDFCDTFKSGTGAPGTTGCLGNCGYGILHSNPAKTFRRIGYWLDVDGHLAMDPTSLDGGDYDALHYAFININSDFSIDETRISSSKFLKIKSKKIASFGGYTFSTSPSTYKVFRNIVSTTTSRGKFASNLIAFMKKYNLDGIDLDWEYPAAKGIPGIPDDYKGNGNKYLELVKSIRSMLPAGKTLSVAIPATFYYLKAFPVKEMQDYVDYFVFMTYDFHGSWDTDKKVTCGSAKTDITDAMKVLDKAGVKMWKLCGGIATYGHSYRLSSASCTDIGCSYSGLGATRPTTNTAGILADSELNDIAASNLKVKRWTDTALNSDIMVYDQNNWVCWNKASQRNSLQSFFKASGLGGTAVWAVNYLKH